MSGGWNTIESDAGVFTSLIESLGVKNVQFEELLTLDPSELLALRPVYGVIFLFKYPTDDDDHNNRPYAAAAGGSDGPLDGTFDHDAAERLFFASQTIQNACATQALLSVLLNVTSVSSSSSDRGGDNTVDVGDELRAFRDFAMALPPDLRGEALGNSDLIRATHNKFARSSPFADETARDAADATEDAFHFVAYTSINGMLYELDGLQPAPISHGPCCQSGEGGEDDEEEQQGFARRVVDVLQRRVARYANGEIRFNLLAMCRDLRVRALELGDEEALARERHKRQEWRFENALRRHNFVAFAGEVLRGVAADRLRADAVDGGAGGGGGTIDKWVAESLERREAAEKAMRRQGGGEDTEMS